MAEHKYRQYDVIVVGAGMVGASFACLFARANPQLQIALVEAYQGAGYSAENFDPRVAALTEKSRSLLECCGVWTQIAEKRVSPYMAMDVWHAAAYIRRGHQHGVIGARNRG